MAVERAFFCSFSHRGAAYAVGPGLARYDAQHDCWEELLPAASLPRSHFGAARVGSRLYVLGGFSPVRGEPPGLLALPQALVSDGSLWIVGGLAVGGAPRRVLWRYDLAGDRWDDLAAGQGEK